jgi:Flp pilus assembly pilin Flp
MNDKLMLGNIRIGTETKSLGSRLEKGQNTTEYGIFIAGVVIVVLLVVGIFSGALTNLWNKVADLISGG